MPIEMLSTGKTEKSFSARQSKNVRALRKCLMRFYFQKDSPYFVIGVVSNWKIRLVFFVTFMLTNVPISDWP